MAKPIKEDGKVFRLRRGKLVQVPPEWVGKVTSRQTINGRPSKQLHKHRKATKYGDRPITRKKQAEKEDSKQRGLP